MNFKFVGNLSVKEDAIKKDKSANGTEYKRFNGAVVKDNDRAFVELFGMKPKDGTIKFFDNDRKSLSVDWDDRFDPSIVKSAATFSKNYIDKESYLSAWDAIDEIEERLDDLTAKPVVVSGMVQKNFYDGKVSNRFVVRNITFAAEDAKPQLNIGAVVYFRAEDFDLDNWKDEKKILLNGFTSENIDKDHKGMFVPQTFVIDAGKIDFDNEKHVKRLGFILRAFGLDLVDGKPKVAKLKKKKVYSLGVDVAYINSAQEVEWTEEMLTDSQREAVELGLKTLDECRPKDKRVWGDRETMLKIKAPTCRDEYADGFVESDLTEDEFTEKIYTGADRSTKIDEKEIEDTRAVEKSAKKGLDDDDDDDLFA